MASFIDVENITYCGKEYGDILSKDLYALDLREAGVTYMDGVKGKTKLYTGELGDLFQPYTCNFTPDGEVVLGEWFFEPVAIKINMEECYDKFWNTFLVEQTEISIHGGIPQTFSDWFFAKFRAKQADEYQEIFWQGDTKSAKKHLSVADGVEKQLQNNADVQKLTGKITLDNVVSLVEAAIMKGIEVAASGNTSTDKYKIIMNPNDVRMLEVALGKLCCDVETNRTFSNYGKQNGHIYVMGYEVVPAKVSASTIIFGPVANLVLGFDTFDSHLEYKLIDMRNTTGDNMFRILSISNIAVGIVFPELFVISQK